MSVKAAMSTFARRLGRKQIVTPAGSGPKAQQRPAAAAAAPHGRSTNPPQVSPPGSGEHRAPGKQPADTGPRSDRLGHGRPEQLDRRGQGALSRIKTALPRVGTALAAIESLDFQPFRRRDDANQPPVQRIKAAGSTAAGGDMQHRADPKLFPDRGRAADNRTADVTLEVPPSSLAGISPVHPVGLSGSAGSSLRVPADESHEIMPESAGQVRQLDGIAVAEPSGRKPPWLFLAMVVLPALVVGVYFGFFAANRYTSEATYIISKGGAALAGGSSIPGLARSDQSSEAIIVYFQSRDAAEHLAKDVDLEAKLMHPSADLLSAYPGIFYDETREGLYEALRDSVEVTINPDTGISNLSVTAFTPEDARELVNALLKEAEALINRMNERATRDAIAFAENVATESEDRVREIQKRMTAFRNSESILDPNVQSSSQIELMTSLSQQLTTIDTEIAQLRASAPKNPRLASLSEQRNAVAAQVDKIRLELAGSDTSLAPKLSAYENLSLERDLAIQALTHAYTSLEEARQEAFVNRLYLQTISVPNLPDRPSFPEPLYWTALVAAIGYALYRITRTGIREAMEHSA